MAGVYRPYTLVDVLGTLNQQTSEQGGQTVTGLGYFAETDEVITTADTVTATVQANTVWDSGQWGAFAWT